MNLKLYEQIDRFFIIVLVVLRFIFYSKIAFETYYYGGKNLMLALWVYSDVLYSIMPYLVMDYVNLKTIKNHLYLKLSILLLANIMIFMLNKPQNMNLSGNIDIINVILLMLFYLVNILYLVYYLINVSKALVDKQSKEK